MTINLTNSNNKNHQQDLIPITNNIGMKNPCIDCPLKDYCGEDTCAATYLEPNEIADMVLDLYFLDY